MRGVSKVVGWPALALGAMVLVTGCGAKSPSTLLGKVKATHQLVIAESAFKPEDYQNATTKQWTGYDVKILQGFAHTLGAHLKFDALPFSSSITAVADKRADITIDIYYSASRAKVLAFSRPMLNYNDAVVVNSQHPGVTQDTVAGLAGKKIAVVTGSAEVAEAKAIPHATIKYYGSVAESFLALSDGRVAADLQPDTDVSAAKQGNPGLHIKILGMVPQAIAPPLASLRGYYGVPKGAYSASFLRKLNTYLKNIAANGTEQKILDQYGMTSGVFLKGIAQAPNTYHG